MNQTDKEFCQLLEVSVLLFGFLILSRLAHYYFASTQKRNQPQSQFQPVKAARFNATNSTRRSGENIDSFVVTCGNAATTPTPTATHADASADRYANANADLAADTGGPELPREFHQHGIPANVRHRSASLQRKPVRNKKLERAQMGGIRSR